MDKAIRETVNRYIASVSQQLTGLTSAYIFGSYARNMQRAESDIDVALVIENLADSERFDTQVRLMLLAAKIDTRIEPHPISKQELQSNNPLPLKS